MVVAILAIVGNANNGGAYVPPDVAVNPETPAAFQPANFPSSDPLVAVGAMSKDRAGHTATLLDDGRVLIAGGYGVDATGTKSPLDGVEIYDPVAQTFEGSGSLLNFRSDAVATKLKDGKVLIAGGNDIYGSATDSAEIYDPKARVSVATGSMAGQVASAAAVALDDGRVLIVGGVGGSELRVGAQIFDPATGEFTPISADFYGSMTATKLQDGRVLVAGGLGSDGAPSDAAWIFDPSVATFSRVGNMSIGRSKATAGLLPDGRVMVVGGMGLGNSVNHTADIYDPSQQAFVAAQDLADYRYRGTATILGDGTALLVGGVDQSGTSVASVELAFPGQGSKPIGSMAVSRADLTSTLLSDGTVLIVGGITASGVTTNSAALYAPNGVQPPAPTATAAATSSALQPADFPNANPLFAVGSLHEARAGHTATLLDDGRVLIAGGHSRSDSDSVAALDSVEIFNPATKKFQVNKSLLTPRTNAAAAKLKDGTVLIAGGSGLDGVALDTAEVYDPKTGNSVATTTLNRAVASATAITLDDGRVLLVGGISPDGIKSGAQIFDPTTRTFAGQTADIDGPVAATKLKDGRVLVAGGTTPDGPSHFAWIFNPAANSFSKVGNLSIGRQGAGSGLLPDGRVIVVGGFGPGGAISSTADIYDPKLGTFSSTQDLADYRYRGTTTILKDGSALLVGGIGAKGAAVDTIETDLPAQPPIRIGTMNAGLADQTATLLKDGTVLIVGGMSVADLTTADANLYVPKPREPAAPSVSP